MFQGVLGWSELRILHLYIDLNKLLISLEVFTMTTIPVINILIAAFETLIDRLSQFSQPSSDRAILLAQLLISRSESSFKNPTGVGGKAGCFRSEFIVTGMSCYVIQT